jgi:hypothetical protein
VRPTLKKTSPSQKVTVNFTYLGPTNGVSLCNLVYVMSCTSISHIVFPLTWKDKNSQ